ncbi:hypothetical protein BRC90_01360 [Halobacteriales archaeon QS_4_69_34]|jgi:outer membrane murein-binding lipoprotein Lpp|nr:MAG: hypothetical protein BRC90_01360 [Halobacteriales archaeon QS_4_69_34]
MGLGSTAKKLQTVADMAEKLYGRVDELREQVAAMREQVETTGERVERIEHELHEQRALLGALAETRDVDVERVLAEAGIEDAEPGTSSGRDGSTAADGEPNPTPEAASASEPGAGGTSDTQR